MRSAMRAASQLPGNGPTDLDDAPALLINQKSDYDMMITNIFMRIERGKCSKFLYIYCI